MWKKGIAILLCTIMFVNPISCFKTDENWGIRWYNFDKNIEEEYQELESTAEIQVFIQETDNIEETEEKEFETIEETKEIKIIAQEGEGTKDEIINNTINNETESSIIETTINEELENNQQSVTEPETTISTTFVIEIGITPEKLISDMIQCENEQNWEQYLKYWVSSSQSYWQMAFHDEEFMKKCLGVTTVRSAHLLGIGEVGLEFLPSGIQNDNTYKDITNWKAYLTAIDYSVEKVTNGWYNGVAYCVIVIGKEDGEWRVIEVSEVDLVELCKFYLSCLDGDSLFEWLREDDLKVAITIRDARIQGVLLDGDLSVVENISINPNAIEEYLNDIANNPNIIERYYR